ncbi:MAG: YggS family pyridoxal phosphate-dependent enzyme [Bacteroidota bacterium]|nr:YggS family pyridoxal phosphate-dependent enzyme [Bacteroidota bacterium]MDP3146073.1 YggS family pyridoxal phosphate-dependent enzyme [Bacteroidota bacterium]
MSVKENLLEIKNTLPSNVTLVAVSKTKPNEMILEAYEAGHRDFGENYVQELVDKYEQLPKDINWHFIGHLQSNKIKYIAPFVYLIHGVDSVKLLEEINKQAKKNNRTINCLLQIFIAQEETKFGFSFDECELFLNSDLLSQLKNINIIGFMAMASNTENVEQIRKEFKSLKEFASKSLIFNPSSLILSFGMSSDYKIAIGEGSTMIRVGSMIFGQRNYNI